MLTQVLEFAPGRDEEFFAAIPAAAAVFLLRGEDERAEPYVSKTANLRRRLQRLLSAPTEQSRKLNLRERVRLVEFHPSGSDFESGFLLYKVLREVFPKTYGNRMRFRFAPLVKLHLDNQYPRASITTRLSRTTGANFYYGPFQSRAGAEKFANDSLDFYKMRRCIDDLNPDPAFPGCIYSEMKMCLAPCFRGCSDEEYSREVNRVQAFFDSKGHSLVREITTQRDQASADLQFEDAAALHTRLDKLKPLLAQLPEIVQRIDRLCGLIVQPSAIAGCVTFFRVDAGRISEPLAFPIQPEDHTRSQSMESRVQAGLQDIPPIETKSGLEAMEHLAILKRWYYRSSRVGEIFVADEKGELPMRRIVRGIARVYRGEKEPQASTPSQQELESKPNLPSS